MVRFEIHLVIVLLSRFPDHLLLLLYVHLYFCMQCRVGKTIPVYRCVRRIDLVAHLLKQNLMFMFSLLMQPLHFYPGWLYPTLFPLQPVSAVTFLS